jgi:hypothetical protein
MSSPEAQARLARVVDALFRSWPSLVGFSVATIERELVLADVETGPYRSDAVEVCGAIAFVLLRLIKDCPATRQFLLGRTFARTLH